MSATNHHSLAVDACAIARAARASVQFPISRIIPPEFQEATAERVSAKGVSLTRDDRLCERPCLPRQQGRFVSGNSEGRRAHSRGTPTRPGPELPGHRVGVLRWRAMSKPSIDAAARNLLDAAFAAKPGAEHGEQCAAKAMTTTSRPTDIPTPAVATVADRNPAEYERLIAAAREAGQPFAEFLRDLVWLGWCARCSAGR